MGYLKKSESLFPRGEDGNLLPIEVSLEGLKDKPMIKVLPITRGKFNEIMAMPANKGEEQDNNIILEHCIMPKFNEEEVKDLKPNTAAAIINAIMSLSVGKTQESLNNQSKEAILDEQEKKSNQTTLE